MSFLGIAFLFALPLAALPVVLHFIDRRRNVQIEWGAMQFLHNTAMQQTRSRRLKEWLLLLCRVAAIAALIFALARPLASGLWFGNPPRSETFLVIDNSLSTARKADGTTKFADMVKQADELMNALLAGDSLRLLITSPKPTWLTQGSVPVTEQSKLELIQQLNTLAPTLDDSDLLGALMTAVQVTTDPNFQRREIVLLTDGLAANWDTDDRTGWDRLQQAITESKVACAVRTLGLESSAGGNNLAVDKLECRQTVVGLDQPLSIQARIRNHSETNSAAIRANWYVDDKLVEQASVPTIEAGGSKSIVWDHSLAHRGVYAVTCRIDVDDVLAGDNDSTIIIEAVDRVPVLVVEYGEGFSESDQDAYFMQAALGQVTIDGTPTWRSVYEPRVISPAQLTTIELNEFRAVVIPNLQDLPTVAINRLIEFVENGGGLWLALGPRTDLRQFNERFYGDGDGLSPVQLDAIVENDFDGAPVMINPYLGSHPATTQLVDHDKMDTADVIVSQRVRFEPQSLSPDVSVLLGLTNGEPLVVERLKERGRVIVQAIPLRLQWSELIKSQAFVVMVQDWLGYLTQPGATEHNLRPGQPISLRLAHAQHTTATLKDPTGQAIDLTGQLDGDEVTFHTTRTHSPGIYRLELGLSGQAIPFYAQRPASESDLTKLSQNQQAFVNERLSANQTSLDEVATTRAGQPIWPLLLMGLVTFMAADVLLSGMISRQRFGVAAITASEPAIGATAVPGYPTPLANRTRRAVPAKVMQL